MVKIIIFIDFLLSSILIYLILKLLLEISLFLWWQFSSYAGHPFFESICRCEYCYKQSKASTAVFDPLGWVCLSLSYFSDSDRSVACRTILYPWRVWFGWILQPHQYPANQELWWRCWPREHLFQGLVEVLRICYSRDQGKLCCIPIHHFHPCS